MAVSSQGVPQGVHRGEMGELVEVLLAERLELAARPRSVRLQAYDAEVVVGSWPVVVSSPPAFSVARRLRPQTALFGGVQLR